MQETPALVQRALSSDSQIRFAVLDASPLWDGVRRGHPRLDPAACACLVELLSAALLLQSRADFKERLQLLVKGSGRARAVVADAWPDGTIRGILDERSAGGPGTDRDPWVQAPGLLNVMRSDPSGTPYVGALELVVGGLGTQIEAYLLQSEQVQASLTLWCEPSTGEAGGLLVEPMPGCPPERLAMLVHAVEGLEVVPLAERTPDFLATWVNMGEGARVLSTTPVRYHCRCSRESLAKTLVGFGKARLDEMFVDDEPLAVTCDYCGKTYSFSRMDLPGEVR